MDNTQIQILNNFRGLFGRYKAVVAQNDRTTSITVDGSTVEIQNSRVTQTQIQSTKL